MRTTRSLRLLVAIAAFCAGLVLGGWTAGVGAHAARTPHKLNPPTALWKAYPLGVGHAGARAATQPAAPTTTRAEIRRPPVTRDRLASRPASSDSGVPIVLMTAGLVGALLVSLLLAVRQAAPVRRSVVSRGGGHNPPKTLRAPARRTARRKVSPKAARPRRLLPVKPDAIPVHATPEPPAPETTAAAAAQPRVDAATEQLGEIRLWRGYVKCQLYVEIEGAAGALAESRFFRLRNPMAPDDAARRVLAELLVGLERAGWSVVESGPGWYRRRLQRPTPSS